MCHLDGHLINIDSKSPGCLGESISVILKNENLTKWLQKADYLAVQEVFSTEDYKSIKYYAEYA